MRTHRFELEESQLSSKTQHGNKQYHVCGIIVNVATTKIAQVKSILSNMDGCEIHNETAQGQLVVTVEDHENILSYEQLENIQKLEGILSVDLVNHYFDDLTDTGPI